MISLMTVSLATASSWLLLLVRLGTQLRLACLVVGVVYVVIFTLATRMARKKAKCRSAWTQTTFEEDRYRRLEEMKERMIKIEKDVKDRIEGQSEQLELLRCGEKVLGSCKVISEDFMKKWESFIEKAERFAQVIDRKIFTEDELKSFHKRIFFGMFYK